MRRTCGFPAKACRCPVPSEVPQGAPIPPSRPVPSPPVPSPPSRPAQHVGRPKGAPLSTHARCYASPACVPTQSEPTRKIIVISFDSWLLDLGSDQAGPAPHAWTASWACLTPCSPLNILMAPYLAHGEFGNTRHRPPARGSSFSVNSCTILTYSLCRCPEEAGHRAGAPQWQRRGAPPSLRT